MRYFLARFQRVLSLINILSLMLCLGGQTVWAIDGNHALFPSTPAGIFCAQGFAEPVIDQTDSAIPHPFPGHLYKEMVPTETSEHDLAIEMLMNGWMEVGVHTPADLADITEAVRRAELLMDHQMMAAVDRMDVAEHVRANPQNDGKLLGFLLENQSHLAMDAARASCNVLIGPNLDPAMIREVRAAFPHVVFVTIISHEGREAELVEQEIQAAVASGVDGLMLKPFFKPGAQWDEHFANSDLSTSRLRARYPKLVLMPAGFVFGEKVKDILGRLDKLTPAIGINPKGSFDDQVHEYDRMRSNVLQREPVGAMISNATRARQKTAVVGGGIFGVTTAWLLAYLGHPVDLFEPNDLMRGATGKSNLRGHQGYYYPSPETALTAKAVTDRFMEIYGDAVVPNTRNYYGVSPMNVMNLTYEAYLNFLKSVNLDWMKVYPSVLRREKVPYAIRANEHILDAERLRFIGKRLLDMSGVHVIPEKADAEKLKDYDFVVHASYEAINELVQPGDRENLVFQIIEQVVMKLPEKFKDVSVVVFGDAMGAIDPRGSTGLHVISHRDTMLHEVENVGNFPIIKDPRYKELLRGDDIKRVDDPALTHRDAIISALMEYVNLAGAEYIGSIYAMRALGTAALKEAHRPTLLHPLMNGRGVVLLGGKILTAVQAAHDVAATLHGEAFVKEQLRAA